MKQKCIKFINYGKLGLVISVKLICDCGSESFEVIDFTEVKCLKCKRVYKAREEGGYMGKRKKKRKEIAFIIRVAEYKKRGLSFFMENAKIPCQECRTITEVHAYGRSKQVIRYACWNKKCSLYGIEQTMTDCHKEIKRYLTGG